MIQISFRRILLTLRASFSKSYKEGGIFDKDKNQDQKKEGGFFKKAKNQNKNEKQGSYVKQQFKVDRKQGNKTWSGQGEDKKLARKNREKEDKNQKDLLDQQDKAEVKDDKKVDDLKKSKKEQKSVGKSWEVKKEQVQKNKEKGSNNRRQSKQEKDGQKDGTKKKPRDQWQNIAISEKKNQIYNNSNKQYLQFEATYARNQLQNQLLGLIDDPNKKGALLPSMKYLMEKNINSAEKLFFSGLLPKLADSNKVAFSEMSAQIILSYLRDENIQGIARFTNILETEMQKNANKFEIQEQSIINMIYLVSQSDQSINKYTALRSILKIWGQKKQNNQISQKLNQIAVSIVSKFCQQVKSIQQQQNPSNIQNLCDHFEPLFRNLFQKQLLAASFVKTQAIFNVFQILYYGKCTNPKRYMNFFECLTQIKASIVTQSDKLLYFYSNFLQSLDDYQLKTTNCDGRAFQANQVLRKNYLEALKEKKKEKVVGIIAICLNNKNIQIPQQFLKENQKYFSSSIPIKVLNQIKEAIKMIKYSSLVADHERNKNKIKQAQGLKIQIEKNSLLKLKTEIISKNYEKAMKIFYETIQKDLVIKKEAMIIHEVLHQFFKQVESDMRIGDMSLVRREIKQFVAGLDQAYLVQSWKKSQDLGYLLQDYYIKPGEQVGSQDQKKQKRFSFWDKFFQQKRAREISKFEMLNELDTIKEPNQNPYLDSQFNLNQYLSEENIQKYKEASQYVNRKEIELEQFIVKSQSAVIQLKAYDNQFLRKSVIGYQKNLCEQNLKVLQEFGLKDYDINIHDMGQFQNRLQNFRNLRGVNRPEQVYQNRVYYNHNLTRLMKAKQKLDAEQESLKLKGTEEQKVVGQGQATEAPAEQPPAQEAVEQAQPQVIAQAEENQQAVQVQEGQAKIVQGQKIESSSQEKKHISTQNPLDIYRNDQYHLKRITIQFLDLLRVKRRESFKKHITNIKLQPSPLVQELISWGLLNKHPMAIYMGEKLAMLTNQTIPHRLAIRVSDLFSYDRKIEQSLFVDCKNCLTHIGKIERQFIYDGNKIYQHILERPYFSKVAQTVKNRSTDRIVDLKMFNSNLLLRRTEEREKFSINSLF